jgi:two-component system alkaline phosphatase synthesis response regulator PhoP
MHEQNNDYYNSVLIVEDDPVQTEQLERLLEDSGYFTYSADDPDGAVRVLERENIDLVLLDLMLGDETGMDVLRTVKRQRPGFPVLILSSLSYIEDKISAFETGVDDYVTKPYHPAELVLRIKRLMKQDEHHEHRLSRMVRIHDTEFDVANGIIIKGNKHYFLRRKVLELLLLLYRNAGRTVARRQIIEKVWHDEIFDENVLSVSIHELRKYVEPDPRKPRVIKTVKGVGYRLQFK